MTVVTAFLLSHSQEQENAVDEISEKQFNPISAITFPIGAAVLTFTAMVVVSLVILLVD